MKVSIITVCLNSEQTIEDTILSVKQQEYGNIEHIFVDGGSTDGTIDIINKYNDNGSQIISQKDNGIYDAMNKGLQICSGDITGFLNADDFYADNFAIQRIADTVKLNDVDCCYGDLEYVAKNNPEKQIRIWRSTPYRDNLFNKGWHPPHPTFFAKKNVFDRLGHFDLNFKIAADYEIMLRFLKRHRIKSCHIPQILVKMRAGGRSNRNLVQIIRANIECYRAWKINDLPIGPFIMMRKPLSKLVQCRRKKLIIL
ncbi:MAG: glycosyl transferase [Flavobacteriaceae bacterium]|nr:glycosyl transferase [Flavobacteriaceae bacterium]